MKTVAIIGASGAIGSAFAHSLARRPDVRAVHAFSRTAARFNAEKIISGFIDLTDEPSIAAAAAAATKQSPLDLVIVATGMLHTAQFMPEKSLRDLSAEKFGLIFAVNTFGPALVAKHFLPELNRSERAIFAALSARVGSISDNRLGGWYAYRASKAALNMIVRTATIETARRAPQAIIVGLHPGTVDSRLSKPFQGNASARTIFEPASAASQLLGVLEGLRPEDSGKCFAYDGQEVLP
jgi:NAD(P)-dependent dehydrogenase (short-subunit alcohol dehydrogenase family)